MLDDFTFYENREQSLKAKRRNKPAPQTEIYKTYNVPVSYPFLSLTDNKYSICYKIRYSFIFLSVLK